MIEVKKEGVILQKDGLEFEDESVLNPAVIKEGNDIHVFYRAVHIRNYS
ncbi:MAG: beta,2-mannobiose phosphorylase / 1,2-beta-oligomannan phosphorylase, partial [Mucilaginibacter sp.]|nr:beta,2-mannobiose phosphorylase / 1,2-beta-oligomannan phosphorylase [Mucilaginibacter sp.]